MSSCGIGNREQICFQFFLNSGVLLISRMSLGSRFQTRGAATENARSPNLSRVLGTSRSRRLAERNETRPGLSATSDCLERRVSEMTRDSLTHFMLSPRRSRNHLLCDDILLLIRQ